MVRVRWDKYGRGHRKLYHILRPALITSDAPSTPNISEAANDNQPVADNENDTPPDDIVDDTPTEETPAQAPIIADEPAAPAAVMPEPANDNPPPNRTPRNRT